MSCCNVFVSCYLLPVFSAVSKGFPHEKQLSQATDAAVVLVLFNQASLVQPCILLCAL